jgi:hypothetical protein
MTSSKDIRTFAECFDHDMDLYHCSVNGVSYRGQWKRYSVFKQRWQGMFAHIKDHGYPLIRHEWI